MTEPVKKALFWTVYDRVHYIEPVLDSWRSVRIPERWHFLVMIDPSHRTEEVVRLYEKFFSDKGITDYEIHVNEQLLGAPENPYAGFQKLFGEGYNFVVLSDDDLIVADDVLEYFDWAIEAFVTNERVLTIGAFSQTSGDPADVRTWRGFKSWVWGTYAQDWKEIIEPTWDHNYSTHNGVPGVEAGWDWNLNTRIIPQRDLLSVRPIVSRCDNIGVHGVHGNGDNFEQSGFFYSHHNKVDFFEGPADSSENDRPIAT